MSTQLTIRVDDEVSAFVDRAVDAGAGSRAQVINRALKREMRRQAAMLDAEIYASFSDDDLESDAYLRWADRNAAQVSSELD